MIYFRRILWLIPWSLQGDQGGITYATLLQPTKVRYYGKDIIIIQVLFDSAAMACPLAPTIIILLFYFFWPHSPQTQDFLNIEFSFKYGIWELLRHEKIPETHILATLLTGNAWLFNGKQMNFRYKQIISEF